MLFLAGGGAAAAAENPLLLLLPHRANGLECAPLDDPTPRRCAPQCRQSSLSRDSVRISVRSTVRPQSALRTVPSLYVFEYPRTRSLQHCEVLFRISCCVCVVYCIVESRVARLLPVRVQTYYRIYLDELSFTFGPTTRDDRKVCEIIYAKTRVRGDVFHAIYLSIYSKLAVIYFRDHHHSGRTAVFQCVSLGLVVCVSF